MPGSSTGEGRKSGLPQLIRDHFPIKDLLDPEHLEPYARPHELKAGEIPLLRSGRIAGRLSFLDHVFVRIELPGLDLCRETTRALLGYDACATCPLIANPPTGDAAFSAGCGNGCVLRTLAAIRVNGRVIGYVQGPDTPTEGFFRHDLSRLPNGLGEDLVEHRDALQAQDRDTIARAVSRVARRLSRRCELERRLKILRHTRKRIVRAHTAEEVLEAGFSGLQALFGDIDVCFYVLTERGALELVNARGPNHHAQPRTMEHNQGHSGRVIQDQRPLYESNLLEDPKGFLQPGAAIPAQSAYTVPSRWGLDEKPGAFQVSSPVRDRFTKADRQSVWVLVDLMSLAGMRLAVQQERRTLAVQQISLGPWADCIIQAIAAPAGNLVQILSARRRLLQGLADEARRCAHSVTAGVRVYDASAEALRFAACSGEWTDLAKNTEYKRGVPSAGMHTFETEEPFFVPDAAKEPNFLLVLAKTKSLYLIPFRSRSNVAGVLSVDWGDVQPDGEAPHRKDLLRLVEQFESALGVLDSREQDIQRHLVSTLASRSTLNNDELETFAKETVTKIKNAFAARGCSIFLVFPGQDVARLIATTGAKPARPIWYRPGEGLTGWVLESGRCLRLKDAGDESELGAILPPPKPSRKWIEDVEYQDAEGKRRFLAAPMMVGSRVLGVIRLTIKNDLSEFTSEEKTLLLQIAREMAEAIDGGWKQAQTGEELAATAHEIGELHRIGVGFVEAPDLGTLIQQVLGTAITESKMKWGIVRLLNSAKDGLTLMAAQGPPKAALPPILELNRVTRRALSADGPVYVDTTKDGPWQEVLSTALDPERRRYLENVRTCVHVPIGLSGRRMGLVLLESSERVEVPERRLRFLGLLGGYAAVAIELGLAKERLQNELDATRPLSIVGTVMRGFLHEINNHVNDLSAVMNNMAASLKNPVHVDIKIRSAQDTLGLLRDLCDELRRFAPAEQADKEMEPIQLEDLLSKTVAAFARRPANVKVQVRAGHSAVVKGHPGMLRIAFGNIIQNAIEAMPSGGIVVARVESVDGRPAVGFADTGVGMDAETMERCWRPFYSKNPAIGRGFGLAAVREIMTLHRGTVRVESELGKGSKFTLIFPAEDTRE